jgi:hypothetical protein
VLTDLPGVVGEPGGARVLVRRLQGLQVGLERRLCVDDDVLAARKLDDQVGA